LNIATNRRWNNQDGSKGEETVWFRVTVWRRQAEIAAQYLSKGRQVMIEGRLTPDRATGGPRVYQRQDGTYGASYEMTADRIVFLGGRGDTGMASNDNAFMAEPPANYPEDDIPF
jgi:single-strand DNA-binding protein